MSEDIFPEWFGFGRRWKSSPLSKILEDMDRLMEEMFSVPKAVPKETFRERKLSDGSIVQEYGPFVYGYSIFQGPDGKTVVKEFGNVRPPERPLPPRQKRLELEPSLNKAIPKPELEAEEGSEPLVDMIMEGDSVKVYAELPGADRSKIDLKCTGRKLTISAETSRQNYYKEVELPVEVDNSSLATSYKNGVLEVTLKRQNCKSQMRKKRKAK